MPPLSLTIYHMQTLFHERNTCHIIIKKKQKKKNNVVSLRVSTESLITLFYFYVIIFLNILGFAVLFYIVFHLLGFVYNLLYHMIHHRLSFFTPCGA